MASLKQLKLKRVSINKTRQVTKAMESVSAVKMRKAQEAALAGRTYAAAALRILSNLSETFETKRSFFHETRDTGAYGLIIITSDKGMAGSLNSSVLRLVDAFLENPKYANDDIRVMCIGRRGHEFAQSRGLTVIHYEENKKGSVQEDDVNSLTDTLVRMHQNKETRAWYIFYTDFKSTFEQTAVKRRILPLSQAALDEVVADIIPIKGKYADTTQGRKSAPTYTIEPSSEGILELILPALINIMLYHALLETKASEHSARMVAMKSATDKATEMSRDLLLAFNKARQSVITSEVSEITSGIEAMK